VRGSTKPLFAVRDTVERDEATDRIADYELIIDREVVVTEWHRMASSGHPLMEVARGSSPR